MTDCWIPADWPAPDGVVAGTTTRLGGISVGPYASFNLAAHVGDAEQCVAENRRRLRDACALPAEPRWLRQVHGVAVVTVSAADSTESPPEADAAITRDAGVPCVVLTADCLPILLCATDGPEVAAVHAGWRGLAAGVLTQTIAAMSAKPDLAWLGPAISQAAYEVGTDVRDAFVASDDQAASAFAPNARGRWQADLYALARQQLAASGVASVYGGDLCTHSDGRRFFSHRRDGPCGRMASVIFIRSAAGQIP